MVTITRYIYTSGICDVIVKLQAVQEKKNLTNNRTTLKIIGKVQLQSNSINYSVLLFSPALPSLKFSFTTIYSRGWYNDTYRTGGRPSSILKGLRSPTVPTTLDHLTVKLEAAQRKHLNQSQACIYFLWRLTERRPTSKLTANHIVLLNDSFDVN